MSTPPRPKPDGSRTVQVRILTPQTEPGPFADLPDITPDQMRLIFAFAARRPTQQPTTQTP